MRAARFRSDEAELAIKAAASMKLRVLKVTSDTARIVAEQLPAGRIYASGLAFVPEIKEAAYLERLQELTDPKAAAAPRLPSNWNDIGEGSLVIACDRPGDGFYEAIVTSVEKDMLTFKFRNYPLAPPQTCHRTAVALLKPSV